MHVSLGLWPWIVTFSFAMTNEPAFSCIEATVPLWVSPSLSCKNRVVLPEPEGPSNNTDFPVFFASKKRNKPAAK